MNTISVIFNVNGTNWEGPHIEELAYQRNLHVLHQMKTHGMTIKNGETILSDDDIDYLTKEQAWKVSVENRMAHTGQEIQKMYQDSFAKSDEMWKELVFSQNKPMRRSYCHMKVEGVSLEEFMKIMGAMQRDEKVGLSAHPEHFQTIVNEKDITGIEPFGMYGTPTLVHVAIIQEGQLSATILADKDETYPISMTGLARLTDNVTDVNIPYHQFKPLKDGFEAKLAVYWPEQVVDEIVEGHSLHLATEFYEGLKMIVKAQN